MNEELKPVRCGCGGEPVVGHIKKTSYLPKDRWYIGCPKCDICTGLYDTEAEVITAWNKAMGERTAKVVTAGKPIEGTDKVIAVTSCENCKNTVSLFDNYCCGCGARLEWK